jgi:hypothetical protein
MHFFVIFEFSFSYGVYVTKTYTNLCIRHGVDTSHIYKFTTFVTELGSVTEGRLGPAQHSRSSGSSQKADRARPGTHGVRDRHRRPTGLGSALPDSRISTDRARRGGCRVGSVTEGRPGSA